ncbi:MAG: Nre family DNA repair protein [Candidatus Altiarchaeota archaeon]
MGYVSRYQSWERPRCKIFKEMQKMYPRSKELCLICKGGRLLCGLPNCPIIEKISIQIPIKRRISREIFGPSPSIFVGWHNYPRLFIGPMTSLDSEKAEIIDNPRLWYGANFSEIIEMRSLLVRSKRKQKVDEKNKFLQDSQEIALSVKPIDIETKFKKEPTYKISFSAISQPIGPSGEIENFKIVENPKIPKKVDTLISEKVNAKDAVFQLYNDKFDVYYLATALSSGVFGREENRRIVPTRWSITAIDDIIAKELMKKIRQYPEINEFLIYSNEYLFNHFEILLMPGRWEFEQFEAWAPKTLWTQKVSRPVIVEEHEPFKGRKTYAIKEGGGYYAGRLAVVEALEKIKRQAKVIVFREISEGYIMPVGVWEVRENVRKAFNNPPEKFSNLNEALKYINSKLTIPIKEYIMRSEILKQKRINEY